MTKTNDTELNDIISQNSKKDKWHLTLSDYVTANIFWFVLKFCLQSKSGWLPAGTWETHINSTWSELEAPLKPNVDPTKLDNPPFTYLIGNLFFIFNL